MEAFGEYDPATPLHKAFCQQITVDEFDQQGTETTYNALQELMKYMDEYPEQLKGVLIKKKQEEQENAGMLSYLKCKLWTSIKGDAYFKKTISSNDCEDESLRLQVEMKQAFNYGQEAKNSGRRFSKRIASKNKADKKAEFRMNIPSCPPPPPLCRPPSMKTRYIHVVSCEEPPLYPVPKMRPSIHSTPLTRKCELKCRGRGNTTIRNRSHTSTTRKSTPFRDTTNTMISPDSVFLSEKSPKRTEQERTDMHDEIRGFSRNSLHSVTSQRSPGRTPYRTSSTTGLERDLMGNFSGVSLSSLQQVILDKFRNIRSPTDAQSPMQSPNIFTP